MCFFDDTYYSSSIDLRLPCDVSDSDVEPFKFNVIFCEIPWITETLAPGSV